MKRNDIRNVAVIAHVDHGKTTLVDQMLRQSGQFRSEELDKLVGGQHGLIMDSNDQERERGITILAKNCGIRIGDVKVNLIDTPGHADFGGEVERILKMADGAFVLVDAAEGPLPQTRFVLRKAFAAGLRPIVIINKIDRPDARVDEIHSQMFDLFIELGADEETADFPVIYASGRAGIATTDMKVPPQGPQARCSTPSWRRCRRRRWSRTPPLQMQVAALQYSEFVGKIADRQGVRRQDPKNQKVTVVKQKDGTRSPTPWCRCSSSTGSPSGRSRRSGPATCARSSASTTPTSATPSASSRSRRPAAADHRRADPGHAVQGERLAVRRPGGASRSPAASCGTRLEKELQHNVALRVKPGDRESEFIVSGRGLLHLGVLLETMRREGSELAVGKPRVIVKEVDGKKHEPYEYLVVEAPTEHSGSVMRLVLERQGECVKMEGGSGNATHMEFHIPARGLIGLRTRMLTATQGTAIMHHNFLEYRPLKAAMAGRANGVLISLETSKATAYAIEGLQERGLLFVSPMEAVYEGQIVGEHNRDKDMR
jgi:GTP-binding protein